MTRVEEIDKMMWFKLNPTEDEMVGCHLYSKLMRRPLPVNELINEINVYRYDPWMLRLQSKAKSRDPFWFFFSPVEKSYENGDRQNRKTPSGFWKITGKPKPIHDRWGLWTGNRAENIGFMKVLRFHFGNTANSGEGDWIIHEYHNTMVAQHLGTHVLCRMEYKGDDIRFICDNVQEPSNNTGHEVNQSANQTQHFSGNLNTQEQEQEQVVVSALNENQMQWSGNDVVDEDFQSAFEELREIFQAQWTLVGNINERG